MNALRGSELQGFRVSGCFRGFGASRFQGFRVLGYRGSLKALSRDGSDVLLPGMINFEISGLLKGHWCRIFGALVLF